MLGASGFVGRHILHALAQSAMDPVAAVSRHPHETDEARDWIAADLAVPGVARSVLATVRPGLIINCAGVPGGSSDVMRAANVDLVRNILEAIRESGEAPRFVHLGSAAEYGRSSPGRPIRESHPTVPVTPYGIAKLEATELVLNQQTATRAVVLRAFNIIGAGSSPASLTGSAVRAIRSARASVDAKIQLGPLDAFRDFVHVADVADAVLAAAHAEVGDARVLNVGSGIATQVRDLVRRLAVIAEFDGRVIEVAGASTSRSTDVPWQEADITLASSVLGWRPKRTLDDGLRDAWIGDPQAFA